MFVRIRWFEKHHRRCDKIDDNKVTFVVLLHSTYSGICHKSVLAVSIQIALWLRENHYKRFFWCDFGARLALCKCVVVLLSTVGFYSKSGREKRTICEVRNLLTFSSFVGEHQTASWKFRAIRGKNNNLGAYKLKDAAVSQIRLSGDKSHSNDLGRLSWGRERGSGRKGGVSR